MPTPTYTPLANLTLSSSAASVSFSSFASGYRDLILIISSKSTAAENELRMRFNSDTGSNYNEVATLNLDPISYTNQAQFSLIGPVSDSGGSQGFGYSIIQILDAFATDKHKSILARAGYTPQVYMDAGRWANTSAITNIQLYPSGGVSFASGSTFALYGIAA